MGARRQIRQVLQLILYCVMLCSSDSLCELHSFVRIQARRSSCQILSSNWICTGMLIYYGMFPWNINSDPGNPLGLLSGDLL